MRIKLRPFLIAAFVILSVINGVAQNGHPVQPAIESIEDFPNVRDLTISESGDEAYFTSLSPSGEISLIARISRRGGKWGPPRIASFSGQNKDLEPYLSPDGLSLYFASDRPNPTSTDDKPNFDIWYVTRESTDAPWSDAKNLRSPINTEFNEFYPAIAESGNLYFTADWEISKGRDDIFLAEWNGSTYSEPVSIGDAVNGEGYEFNAYIAPDESFLVFSGYNRPDGVGNGDLYISKRSDTGDWEPAVNLGSEINSPQLDYCPFVHLSSGTLYFTSRRSAVKGPTVSSMQEFLRQISQYENGQSRLYKVDISSWLE